MASPLLLSSVPAQTPYVQYAATASQTVFPYPFEITQDSDLVCLVNGVQLGTDVGYTLSGQGTTGGGNLTFTLGQTAGAVITIYRNIAIARSSQIPQNGGFFSSTFNNEYNRTYLIMQQLQQGLNSALHLPISTNPAAGAVTVLSPTRYANMFLAFDSNGLPTPAAPVTGTITAALIYSLTGIVGPQTALETAAGVTVVNEQYPVGSVDRYGTNTTPGVTSMVLPFQYAGMVAMTGGGRVTYGLTAPYFLDSPVNWTIGTTSNYYGIYLENVGSYGLDAADFGIIASHTGLAVFDCTGNDSITTRNVAITTGTSHPKTSFYHARNSHNSSMIHHHYDGRWVGSFTVANYYNYGSEDDVLMGCYFWNQSATANTATRVYTGNNIKAISTSFAVDMFGNALTAATGAQSCIDHNDFGCLDYNQGGQTTSDCIYVEQADSFKKYGGWAYSANANATANGRALIYVDLTNAASNYGSLNGLTGEQATYLQTYGILFSEPAGSTTCVGWSVNDCKLPNVTFGISSGANVVLDNFKLQGTTTPVGGGISILGTLQNSPSFDYGNEVVVAISIITRSHLTGASENLSYTTLNNVYFADTGVANKTWTVGIVNGANHWTAVGAITQSANGCLSGSMYTFQIKLYAATSIAWTNAATIPTLPFAAVADAVVFITDLTSGVLIGTGKIAANGKTITMTTAQTTSSDQFMLSGTYFVSS